MSQDRIHRAISDDGTEIAGRVHGQGPPLVLVHGAMADGDSDWGALVPLLADRFTCYVPSTRGRGLSGAHPDVSREARVRDITAFVDSIGEPVGLVGLSGGGMLVFDVAVRARAVTAVVGYEPVVFEAIDPETLARFTEGLERMAEVGGQGRAAEAAESFMSFAANEDEFALLTSDREELALAAQYLPLDLEEFWEAVDFEGPSPTDPSVLAQVDVPVLLLQGSRTPQPWFVECVRFAAEHVPDATVRELPGTGHLAPIVEPEAVAAQLVEFFEAARQPA